MYVLVAVIATAVVPAGELATSVAPLSDVVRRAAPWFPVGVFSIVALFAVSNTALLNCVMASRLLYGMSEQRLLPRFLGSVHPQRHTPHLAIALIFVATLGVAASGTLQYLAETTSVLLLTVFFAVHVALLRIKRRERRAPTMFRVPAVVPIIGAASCVLLATFVSGRTLVTAAVVASIGLAIVALRAWLSRTSAS